MKLTHILVAEKLDGIMAWYWIPELDKYELSTEECGDNSEPYQPYYMTPDEYKEGMSGHIYENISFTDKKEKYLAAKGGSD